MMNWFLVVNADGTILAVYGSALGEEAQNKARELSKIGNVALRLVATRKRPSVGGMLPKRSLSMVF
jgi:hypothetical protein